MLVSFIHIWGFLASFASQTTPVTQSTSSNNVKALKDRTQKDRKIMYCKIPFNTADIYLHEFVQLAKFSCRYLHI